MTRERVYLALAALSCFPFALTSSAAAGSARIVSLDIGDRFDVVGTHVSCKIAGSGSGGRVPTLTCRLVRSGTTSPIPNSYAFTFGDQGVDVLGPGSARSVVFRARTDAGLPLGSPAPADRSSRAKGVHLRPVARGLEGVNVARSSVVCVAVAYPRPNGPALNCTLSSPSIRKALGKPRLAFRPLTVTLSPRWLRVWRMSKTKTQRIVFSRRQPSS